MSLEKRLETLEAQAKSITGQQGLKPAEAEAFIARFNRWLTGMQTPEDEAQAAIYRARNPDPVFERLRAAFAKWL